MAEKLWAEWTDEELATGAQKGQAGQGCIVESTRRLRESTERYSRMLIVLTWVATSVLTVLTAVLASHDLHWF